VPPLSSSSRSRFTVVNGDRASYRWAIHLAHSVYG
jgi:hypothetical protein